MFSSAINYHSISIKIAFVICRILLVLQALGRRARNFEMCLNISYHAPVQPGAAHHGIHQQPLQHAAIAAGPAHSFINLAG